MEMRMLVNVFAFGLQGQMLDGAKVVVLPCSKVFECKSLES